MKYHYLAFIDVFQYLAFRTYLLFLQYVAKYVYWRLNLFTRQSLVEWLSKFRKHQGRLETKGILLSAREVRGQGDDLPVSAFLVLESLRAQCCVAEGSL